MYWKMSCLIFGVLLSVACADTDETDQPFNSKDSSTRPQDGAESGGDGSVTTAAEPDMPSPVGFRTLFEATDLPLEFGVSEIEFDVDEDVLSLSVTIYGESTGWYGIDGWTNGDGSSLATADWPSIPGNERGCFSCTNFVHQSQGAATSIAPNRPGSRVLPGQHRLSIVGWEDGFGAEKVSVRIIAKTGTALPDVGIVDLNIYLTGAQGWTAESIQTDPYFAATIARVNQVYGDAGIEVGDITFTDLDPRFSVISIADGKTDLGDLVAQSTLDHISGVNVFFVDEILTGEPDFPSIPGVAASVPNPPYLPGTVASGVAIALNGPLSVPPEQRFLDPPAVGQTLCHELGHALGLFHTSEYDLVSHDIYEDTPDNDNALLMHADGTGDIISPQQRDALFANPIIRHVESQ